MAVNPSIQLGTSGNWAIKEDNLLAYKQLGNKFFDREFDFSRGTSATYVARDGLIKTSDLQSTNLVQNGNFSELGSEQVTNGNFATDTDWTKGTGWSISGGSANCDGTQTGETNLTVPSSNSGRIGNTYKCTFTVSNYSSGQIRTAPWGNVVGAWRSGNGTYTEYIYISVGNFNAIYMQGDASFIGSIDNVSVKEVDPNDNWSLGTGWSIGTNKATSDASVSSYLNQTLYTIGNLYKLKFEVLEGTIELRSAQYSKGTGYYTTGTHEIEVIPTTTSTYFYVYTGFGQSSITNISVKEIKTDVPRIDFTDDTTGHLLLEPQSTNLLTYSEDFSDSYWTKSGTSITPNATTSPDGTTNADNLVEDSANSQHYLQRNFTSTNGSSYTYKIYVKMNGRRNISLRENGSTGYYVSFDLLNGVILEQSNATGTIKELTNGWFEITHTSVAGNSFNVAYYLLSDSYTSGNPQTSPYQGDGVSGFYIWGAMLEQNSFATSYIPTSGSTVTRNQELCNNSGTASDFNSEEGVLYAEIAALANDLTNKQISLNNGTTDDRIQLYYSASSNQISVFYKSQSGATVFILNHTLSDITQFNKVAFKWKQNDFALWSNGVEVATQTSGVTSSTGTLTKLDFQQFNGDADFFGKTKNLKVFKRALTDAELYLLTVTQYQSYQEMATALNYTL